MSAIPVLIGIQSTAHRSDAQEDEQINLLTSGQLELDDAQAVLRYEETLDEHMPPQQVEVIVGEEEITMKRGGAYETQMIFRMGSRYEGTYHTPVGDMALAIYCTRMNYDLGDDGGQVELSYQLDINGRFAAMHDMQMRVARQNHD